MKKAIARLIYLTLICINSQAKSQVVLSEIMFDAFGSDFHNEFIEVVNLSLSDSADLTGWQVNDGFGTDNIIEFNQGMILKPGQFGIILDASYFGNSNTYNELIPPEALILTIDNGTFGSGGLSNSKAETISLISSSGEVVSKYTYTLGNSPGFSDEKIDLAGPNTLENWADSRVSLGTPGGTNSVSPLGFDLVISTENIIFSPQKIQEGEMVVISATIRNIGTQSAAEFEVTFFQDLGEDSSAARGEELAPPFAIRDILQPGDSTTLSLNWENVLPGRHLIIVEINFPLDKDTTNNLAQKELLVGYSEGTLVINEIMYSPLSNQAEWVEFFNRSSHTINLKLWAISDSDINSLIFIKENFLIAPNDYFVGAEDSTILEIFSPPSGSFTVLKNWPSLNNDFDSVVLYDLVGNKMEWVNYSKGWGGSTGISLERINPNLTSNDGANWSSSVVFEGGTPGSENSIFTQVLPSDAVLTIEPNPFSPDGDGNDDFTVINYKLPLSTAVVNIKIFDVRGRFIRFLANNQPSGSKNSIIWDGEDNKSQKARMGIYIVFLQALNAEAGVLKTAKKTVVLAGKL